MRPLPILLSGGPLLLLVLTASVARPQGPPNEDPVRPGLTWRLIDPMPRPPYPWPERMHVTLDVLVNGRALPTVSHAGRTYLPVPRLGEEYSLRVTNHGPRRITAVLSVDGLSVITNRPASRNDPGYIVAPHGSIVITGWRRDRDIVAAFRFEDRERSYAYTLGRPENIGVIGLVAYEERTPRPYPLYEEWLPGDRPLRKATSEVGGTGTGRGRDLPLPVEYVWFVRGPNRETIVLYYDTEEALRRAGVPIRPRFPNPFPEDL